MTRVAIAIALLLLANAAHAQCEFEIEVGDALEYSTEAITVGADCEQVTVTLTHTGKLPPAAMGHNWVLAAPGDVQAIASAGMAAGLENDYLPAGDDRVLAFELDLPGRGDHLLEVFSDMSATYQMTTTVEAR